MIKDNFGYCHTCHNEGRIKFEKGSYGEAFSLFGLVNRMVHEINLSIEANKTLDMNLNLYSESETVAESEREEEIEDVEDENEIVKPDEDKVNENSQEIQQEQEDNDTENHENPSINLKNRINLDSQVGL